MPPVCTVCRHPERAAIDAALVERRALRDIARQFRVSPSALHRHRHADVPERLAQAVAAKDVLNADVLLEQLGRIAFGDPRTFFDARGQLKPVTELSDAAAALLGGFEIVTSKARKGDTVQTVAKVRLRDTLRALELLAKVAGLLKDGSPSLTVNVLASPEWLALRERLLAALAPFPEARLAVLAAIAPGAPTEAIAEVVDGN